MSKRPNGTGSVYFLKDRNCFMARVQVYDPDRRQKSKCFKKKKDAVNALPGLLDELLRGSAVGKQIPTVASLYESFAPSMEKLSANKQTAYRIAYRRLAPIERAGIADLSIVDLQRTVEGLTYYPAKDIKNLLSHLYKRAIAEQAVTVNLSAFIELPALEEKEAEPFTEDEVRALWSAYRAGDVMAAEILLMIYTGMMPGELHTAKKAQIDYANHRIVGAGLKTKERRSRNILLPEVILPVLRFICDSHPEKSVIGINRWKWYDLYHETLTRIGIRDLPPYSCRHTTASALALRDDVSPMLITKVMRHATPLTTERYKHADERSVLETLDKLSAPLSQS